ncbi:hemolymph clottable protein isoform X2 [Hyalella azteca]|uniref:Hemolymph clottable protein isoform X2 n=1 Tax=Hyalella azteca TaxID=294128 RepID=A0A8B7PF11_HYAAZ|nr:hemolymph clottable protein isoform X2 [Hyalella azteca]
MKLLTLLLLVGTCAGLQYPLQYLYHYRAKVSAGIPEINRHQSAKSSIRANLRVYVTSATTVAFKLEDVEYSDCHVCRECTSDPEYIAAFEEPASLLGRHAFGINERGHFVHHAGERAWVLNFYKSIVGLFNISPLRNTFFGTHNGTRAGAYNDFEQTVMGTCKTTYTEHKLSGVALAQYSLFVREHITGDRQLNNTCAAPLVAKLPPGRKARSVSGRKTTKTSVTSPLTRCDLPRINRTVTRVVRSVNLEECVDRVEHQHTMGSSCNLGEDQCENLYSRSSNGIFYIRGDHSGMRLEKAKVKGAIVVSPFGYETEHLQTVTWQKLALVSVEALPSTPPDCSRGTCVEDTQMTYTLTVPYTEDYVSAYKWARPGSMKKTIQEITGAFVDAAGQKKNEQRVAGLIHEVAAAMATGRLEATARATLLLNYATYLMYDFTADELLNVMALIPPAEFDLFYGVIGELGTQPAVTLFLQALKDNRVSAFRQVVFSGSLNNNLKTTNALKPVMDYVLSQNIDAKPFSTSQSLLNLASLVHRLCLGTSGRNDSFTHFAKQQCRRDQILEILQRTLIDRLSNSTKFWKQMVYVKALVNLKTVESTNALLPYALGRRQCDTQVRALALEALASWNAPSGRHQTKITLILLDIFENPAEHPTLRARALAFLSSWPLTSAAWTRLALATKMSGLRDLSALTYSLIKTTSEYQHPEAIRMRQLAQHALSLAKPSSAAERYSAFKSWYRYCFSSQFGSLDYQMGIKDPASPLPAEFSAYVRKTLGGAVFHRKLDVSISNDNGNLMEIISKLLYNVAPAISNAQISTNLMKMLRSDLVINEKVRAAIVGLVSFNPLKDVQIFLPLEHEFIADFVKSVWGSGNSFSGPSTLYVNPVDYTFTTVNDIGLPVITNVAKPTIYHFTGTLAFSRNASKQTFELETRAFAESCVSTLSVIVETMAPWSRSMVAAGVSHTTGALQPYSPKLVYRATADKDHNAGLEITLTPKYETSAIVFIKTTQPYTLLRDTAPADVTQVLQNMAPVEPDPLSHTKYKNEWTLPLNFDAKYEGDIPLSLELDSFFDKKTSSLDKWLLAPSLHAFTFSVVHKFNPTNARVVLRYSLGHLERASDAGRFVSKYGQDSFEDYELCGHESSDIVQQFTGDQSQDEDLWSQQSGGVDIEQSGFNEIQTFGSFGQEEQQQSKAPQKLTILDSTEVELTRPTQQFGRVSEPQLMSFLRNLRRNAGWKYQITGQSIRGEVWRNNQQTASFEAVLATTTCYGLQDQKSTKIAAVFDVTGVPCARSCFEGELTLPKLNDLDTIDVIFAKNLTKSEQFSMYQGDRCETLFSSASQKYSLTEAGKASLKQKLQEKSKCHWSKKTDAVQEFHKIAEYNEVTTTLNVNDVKKLPCRNSFLGFTYKTLFNEIFLKRIMHEPTIDDCFAEDSVKKIQSSGNRDEQNRWFVTRNGQKVLDGVQLPEVAQNFAKIGIMSDYIPGDYCVIQPNSITTYDGLHVNTSLLH